jgi:hypothetical protein
MFLRSKVAAGVAGLYLLTFIAALLYAYFDLTTFPGLPAVLLTLPWVDYFPLAVPNIVAVTLSAVLNAAVIFLALAILSFLVSQGLRRRP